ncbi:MAG: hypothetical protein ACE5GA_09915, partial [Candidatus Zixiibacteriota bacterium]
MADLERLYRRLPPTLQSLACSWQGWRIQRRRYNKDFHSLLATCQSRGALSESELTAFRDERLRSFIQHAAQTTPYYRPRLEECGVSAEDIRSLDDLQRLPVLSKAEVQENLTHLRSSQFAGHDTITTHTSGTTGRGLIFPVTLSAEREQWAIWWRYRIEHGIDIDTPCGVFGGRAIVSAQASKPPFWRYNSPARQILFSGYHLSEENLPAYVAEIRRSRLTWLHGYPSHLTLLAAHILDSGRDPGFQV